MTEESEIKNLIQLLSDESQTLDERLYSAILTNYRLGFEQRRLQKQMNELEKSIKDIEVRRIILKAIIQRLATKKETDSNEHVE